MATRRGVLRLWMGGAVLALLVVACGGGDASETGAEPTASDRPSASHTPSAGLSTSESTTTPEETPDPGSTPFRPEMQVYDVPAGSGPHDVAPAMDGGVCYTAQQSATDHLVVIRWRPWSCLEGRPEIGRRIDG